MGRRGRKRVRKQFRGGYKRRQRERRVRYFAKDYDLLPPFVLKPSPAFEKEFNDKPNIRHRTETVRQRSRNIGFIKSFWTDSRVVQVCKNRSRRRQVLFAKRKAGKGTSGPRLRRYTTESKVRC